MRKFETAPWQVKIIAFLFLLGLCGFIFLNLFDETERWSAPGICVLVLFILFFGHAAMKVWKGK